MPKLLQINSVVNKGSTGRIAEQIGDFGLNLGWKSFIAHGRGGGESVSETIKIGNSFDSKLHAIESRLFDNHGLSSRKATFNLISQITQINPDIIHLHNLHGYYLNYQLLFAYLHTIKIPIVWTLHDCWAFTGHCTFFSDINCHKWETECNHCPKSKNYPSSVFYDNSKNNFSLKRQVFTSNENLTLVPVSNWLGSVVKNSFLKNVPMNVIQNGVDLTSFSPIDSMQVIEEKYSIKNKKILLGVATSWDARKGLADYFKLAGIISKDYVIVLVGLTKKQIESLPASIIGIERTESISTLNELYSAAHIVLNLSNQESFGMTTVEGYASGTPSIVYNCTASPELITHETGLVIEAGNIEALVNGIEKITKNGKAHYSSNCRKLAESNFDKNKKIEAYFNLYEKLISKSKK